MRKKITPRANILLAAHRALAVTGTGGFALTEYVRFEFYAHNDCRRLLAPPDHEYNDRRLREEPAIVNDPPGRPSQQTRFGAPWAFALHDIHRASPGPARSNALTRICSLTIKNPIPLKLRIEPPVLSQYYPNKQALGVLCMRSCGNIFWKIAGSARFTGRVNWPGTRPLAARSGGYAVTGCL